MVSAQLCISYRILANGDFSRTEAMNIFMRISFLNDGIKVLAIAALCLPGSAKVDASEDEIVATCRRYLATEGNDSGKL